MTYLLDFRVWLLLLAVTTFGTVTKLVNYYVGKRGTDFLLARYPQFSQDRWRQIEGWYQQWGGKLLILSAVPLIGMLLTLAAGAYRVRLYSFLFWVALGRFVRNWLFVLLFIEGLRMAGVVTAGGG